jgi:hypothetical protein
MLTEAGFHLSDEGRDRARAKLQAADAAKTDEQRAADHAAFLAGLDAA